MSGSLPPITFAQLATSFIQETTFKTKTKLPKGVYEVIGTIKTGNRGIS